MGTRSLTYVYDTDNTPVVCMYRQYDGYMEGHGLELAEFLSPLAVVNGLGAKSEKVANGMGCLAAQMVAHFKDGAGQFYLHAPVLGQDCCQDYEYHVFKDTVRVISIGSNNDTVVFDDNWEQFHSVCLTKSIQYQERFA